MIYLNLLFLLGFIHIQIKTKFFYLHIKPIFYVIFVKNKHKNKLYYYTKRKTA